jgi:hypothetical protein
MNTIVTYFRFAVLALGLLLALSPSTGFAADKDEPKGVVKPYPLQTCLVTDNDLGSMGDERSFVYEGQEIKICCKPCERKFRKDPARYLKKLQELVAAQQAATAATTPTARTGS